MLPNDDYWQKRRRRTRDIIFEILGGKVCQHCGHKDERALDFDHINDDGKLDRNRFKNYLQFLLYYAARPDEARRQLQVLCANCNRVKEHERRTAGIGAISCTG